MGRQPPLAPAEESSCFLAEATIGFSVGPVDRYATVINTLGCPMRLLGLAIDCILHVALYFVFRTVGSDSLADNFLQGVLAKGVEATTTGGFHYQPTWHELNGKCCGCPGLIGNLQQVPVRASPNNSVRPC